MWWEGGVSLFTVFIGFPPPRSPMAVPARCINRLMSGIILKDTTVEAVNAYVRDTCSEWYDVPPGFKFRGVDLLLPSPMAMGFKRKKKKILVPFVKPCYGPILVEVDARDGDFDNIMERLGSAKG